MEDSSTLKSIAEILFNVLENSKVKELCSVWGYKSDLKKLQETANKIKDLLLDVEHMQGQLTSLSHQDQSLVRDLKHHIYDVEDLVQTFVAHAEQKQLKAQEEGSSSITTKAFQCLQSLNFYEDEKVESLSDIGEVLFPCSSSLQHLVIGSCSKLKSVSGGLKHLTALKTLLLFSLPNVSLSKEDEGEDEEIQGMPWCSLAHSLHHLTLQCLDEVVKLPDGMRYLTTLQSLEIRQCKKLEEVLKWMPELTSLKTLKIYECSSSLHERCRNPTGEDWPYIQHIPNLILDSSPDRWWQQMQQIMDQ